MFRHLDWEIITDVSKDSTFFIFRLSSPQIMTALHRLWRWGSIL